VTGYDDWDVLEAVGNGAMEQCLEGQNIKSFLEEKATL
jgi:hypothetical protein